MMSVVVVFLLYNGEYDIFMVNNINPKLCLHRVIKDEKHDVIYCKPN